MTRNLMLRQQGWSTTYFLPMILSWRTSRASMPKQQPRKWTSQKRLLHLIPSQRMYESGMVGRRMLMLTSKFLHVRSVLKAMGGFSRFMDSHTARLYQSYGQHSWILFRSSFISPRSNAYGSLRLRAGSNGFMTSCIHLTPGTKLMTTCKSSGERTVVPLNE